MGYDFQNLESGAQFDYPNRQYYIAESYNPVTRTPVFGPNSVRQDYDSGPSISNGKIHALFARDKMELSDRSRSKPACAGRTRRAAATSAQATVDTSVIAPRLSGTYDLAGDGNSLITGSYGRYYASIIQGFSDAFAQVAQQTNYNNYVWNGSAFVFQNRVQLSGGDSSFTAEPRSEAVAHGRIHGRLSSASLAVTWAPARASSRAAGATSSTTSARSTPTATSTARC